MKKVLLFFAIAMMAITASAKVYEVSFEKSENITIRRGQSKVINGVKITCLDGNINPSPSWEPSVKGHMWQGECTENDFQISTENGETITSIEITTEEESKWSMYYGIFGTGWTTITKGAAWTGSATSVNVGGEFEQVIKLTVTVDETTGIKNVETTSSQKVGKFIKDGKLVIMKDGKQYNAAGQKM